MLSGYAVLLVVGYLAHRDLTVDKRQSVRYILFYLKKMAISANKVIMVDRRQSVRYMFYLEKMAIIFCNDLVVVVLATMFSNLSWIVWLIKVIMVDRRQYVRYVLLYLEKMENIY